MQSCKGNTTGPKGRDAGGGGQILKNRVRGNRLLHPAGRKLNFVELEAIKTGSGGVEGALQSESRQVTTGEYYLLLGV